MLLMPPTRISVQTVRADEVARRPLPHPLTNQMGTRPAQPGVIGQLTTFGRRQRATGTAVKPPCRDLDLAPPPYLQ